MLNNLLLACACATVLLGTLYPLFLDAVGGDKVSVGPPFFNRTFVPLMVPVIMAMAVGPMLSWKRGDLMGALQRLWLAFGVSAVVMLVMFSLTTGGPVLAVLGLGLAAWTAMGVLTEWADRIRLFRASPAESLRRARNLPRAAYGMTLAHLGMAISVAGISASAFDTEALAILPIGADLPLSGYVLHFDGVTQAQGPNYTADRASITVRRNGAFVAVMQPERRLFPLQDQTTSMTAIRTNLMADLSIALGEPDPSGGWTIRAYWKPLIPWLWIGAVIMAFGGMVSLSDRRWRVAAVTRAKRHLPIAVAGE